MTLAVPPVREAGGGLGAAARASLRYLANAARLPQDDSSAYWPAKSEAGNFGRRFQIAFHAYAIATLGERLPAAAPLTANLLRQLIDRFLAPSTWAYWLARGATLDPVGPHNVQYSGHLGQLIGCYERFANDGRYDRPFVLDDGRASRHEHTHTSVAATLSEQMRANPCHGVTCEPGNIYVACNDHAAIALLQHDAVHGGGLAAPIADWTRWAEQKMVRRRGGVFAVAYLAPYDFVIPLNFQVMDVWSLAFLSPYAPDLFSRLYRRWRCGVHRHGGEAWVPARWPNALLEIADQPQNTAFAYVAAREAGDDQLADRLIRFAERRLGLVERFGERACWNATRTLMVSALFALGEALEPAGLRRSIAARPAGFFERPCIASIEGADLAVAGWDERGAIVAELVAAAPEIAVSFRHVAGEPEVRGGVALASEAMPNGVTLRLRGDRPTVRWPAG